MPTGESSLPPARPVGLSSFPRPLPEDSVPWWAAYLPAARSTFSLLLLLFRPSRAPESSRAPSSLLPPRIRKRVSRWPFAVSVLAPRHGRHKSDACLLRLDRKSGLGPGRARKCKWGGAETGRFRALSGGASALPPPLPRSLAAHPAIARTKHVTYEYHFARVNGPLRPLPRRPQVRTGAPNGIRPRVLLPYGSEYTESKGCNVCTPELPPSRPAARRRTCKAKPPPCISATFPVSSGAFFFSSWRCQELRLTPTLLPLPGSDWTTPVLDAYIGLLKGAFKKQHKTTAIHVFTKRPL